MKKTECQAEAIRQIQKAMSRHDFSDRFWSGFREALGSKPSRLEKKFFADEVIRWADKLQARLEELSRKERK